MSQSQTNITVEVTLAEYVDLMRVRKGLSKADLAARLGVQPRTVAVWGEQGWPVRAERIVQVCNLLDIDPAVFLPSEAA